jgi:hypothetical protein
VRLKETAAQRDAIAVAAGRSASGAKAKSRAVKPR